MPIYRIADLNIRINNVHSYTDKACRKYLAENQDSGFDFEVSATHDDYEMDKGNHEDYSEGYLEYISIYRQIARKILEFDGLILHASVVEMDGKAYAFSAPSGTGKSTHTRLWLEAFDGKARIINGDKPLIRYIDGVLYAYGTPWCGKEMYNVNTRAELKSICFLERASENSIVEIDKNEAVKRIFIQLLLPENNQQTEMFFKMIDILLDKVKFYKLGCNMDVEAAKIAYEGMKQ